MPPEHAYQPSPAGTGPSRAHRREGKTRAPTLTRSVLTSWVSYAAVIVSGFIVPRAIDAYEGKEVLGLWDFGFSLLIYVRLLSLGIGSAINRYVARYHSVENWDGLNAVVNTSLLMLSGSFLLGLVVAAGLTWATPWLLVEAGPDMIALAREVVLLLTAAAALKMVFGVVNGIITGCERFDILNSIRVSRDVVVLGLMLALLALGGSIVALAWCVFLGEVAGNVMKLWMVRRLVPTIRLAPSLVNWPLARDMLQFSGKNVLQGVARTGLYQGNSILLAYFLGPAALAVYSRQRVLVIQAQSLMQHFAHVIVPRSSALDARGDADGLRELLIRTTRYGFYISFPMLAALVIMGGPLVEVWMGRDYRAPLVIAILALGHCLSIPQQTAFSVLVGMGRQGVPALLDVAASLLSVTAAVLLLGLSPLGMTGAALAVAIPVTLSGGLLAPLYACRLLGVTPSDYLRRTLAGPLAAVIPFALCLLLPAALGVEAAWARLACGLGLGAAVLALPYWRWVAPESLKARVRSLFADAAPRRRALSEAGGPSV